MVGKHWCRSSRLPIVQHQLKLRSWSKRLTALSWVWCWCLRERWCLRSLSGTCSTEWPSWRWRRRWKEATIHKHKDTALMGRTCFMKGFALVHYKLTLMSIKVGKKWPIRQWDIQVFFFSSQLGPKKQLVKVRNFLEHSAVFRSLRISGTWPKALFRKSEASSSWCRAVPINNIRYQSNIKQKTNFRLYQTPPIRWKAVHSAPTLQAEINKSDCGSHSKQSWCWYQYRMIVKVEISYWSWKYSIVQPPS